MSFDENNCIHNYAIGHIYYDYTNKLMRFDRYSHDEKKKKTVWMDYNSSEGYSFDRSTGDCYYFPLNWTMHEPTIPKDATYESQRVIGSQALDVWGVSTNSGKVALISVTSDNCYMADFVVLDMQNHQVNMMYNFWNFIPSLPPYFFDLPEKCTSNPTMMHKEHHGKHSKGFDPFAFV